MKSAICTGPRAAVEAFQEGNDYLASHRCTVMTVEQASELDVHFSARHLAEGSAVLMYDSVERPKLYQPGGQGKLMADACEHFVRGWRAHEKKVKEEEEAAAALEDEPRSGRSRSQWLEAEASILFDG